MGSVGDVVGTIAGTILVPVTDLAVRGLEAIAALSGGTLKVPK